MTSKLLNDFCLDIRRRFIDTCKTLEPIRLPNRQECPVGLLSCHWWENDGHKLSVTSQLLSSFFASTLQGSLVAFLFSIQPVKLDLRMFYVCGVPGFLTNDFNARFVEVPRRQFFDQRDDLVEC
jgi:hypothetical protein